MSRPLGSAAELERRRRRAVEAVHHGESPEAVARVVGVDRASVYRWLKLAQLPDGLAAKPHPGPAPRLSPQQNRRLEDLLLQDNSLASFPITAGGLKGLRRLNLGHNAIEQLPSAIGGSVALETLDASSNRLRSLRHRRLGVACIFH